MGRWGDGEMGRWGKKLVVRASCSLVIHLVTHIDSKQDVCPYGHLILFADARCPIPDAQFPMPDAQFLLLMFNIYYRRHPWRNSGLVALDTFGVEDNLDWDTLDYFGEVSGGVVWR